MEVRFEKTERTDSTLWKEEFLMDLWKNLTRKPIYKAKWDLWMVKVSCILYFHFLTWALHFVSCGLAWVCKLMLQWAQNKPIRLMVLSMTTVT